MSHPYILANCSKTHPYFKGCWCRNMASAAAALLDQLMGRNRNAGAGEKTAREHWSDPEVIIIDQLFKFVSKEKINHTHL